MNSAGSTSSELRPLFKLSFAIATLEIVEHLMVLTDLFVVGRLGTNEFAAVGLAGTFFWVIVVIAMAMLSMIGVVIAEARSTSTDPEKLGVSIAQGFWIAMAITIPFSLLTWFMSDLLAITDIDPVLLPIVEEYTRAVVYSLPFSLLFIWLRNYFAAMEISAPVTVIAIMALPINLLMNIWLVFGGLGIPPLGVAGAGYGTSFVSALMLIAITIYLKKHNPEHFRSILKSIPVIDWRTQIFVAKIGGGQVAITLLENGMFAVVSLLVSLISINALVAHNIVFTILEIGILAAVGIGEAATVRVAIHLAQNNRERALATVKLAIAICIAAMVVFAATIVLTPELIVDSLLQTNAADREAVIVLINTFMIAAAISLIFDGCQTILYRVLRATKDEFAPVILAGIGYWAFGVGSAFVLGYYWLNSLAGIWVGLTIGYIATAILMGWRYICLTKKSQVKHE